MTTYGAERKLDNVIGAIDEILDGIIARPRMWGNAMSLELEFITLLELKEVALGRESSPEIYMKDRWMKFVDECFPDGPMVFFLAGRKQWPEDLVEFVSHLRIFREQLGL